jgi:hypothetical protein
MDRNEVEDPKQSAGLRAAAAGLEGSVAHPAPPGRPTDKNSAARKGGDRHSPQGLPAPGGEAIWPRPPEPVEEKRARFTSTRCAPPARRRHLVRKCSAREQLKLGCGSPDHCGGLISSQGSTLSAFASRPRTLTLAETRPRSIEPT